MALSEYFEIPMVYSRFELHAKGPKSLLAPLDHMQSVVL